MLPENLCMLFFSLTSGIAQTHMFLSRFLPIEESYSIRVSHTERYEFDVCLGQVLFFQTIDGALSVFLKTPWCING